MLFPEEKKDTRINTQEKTSRQGRVKKEGSRYCALLWVSVAGVLFGVMCAGPLATSDSENKTFLFDGLDGLLC